MKTILILVLFMIPGVALAGEPVSVLVGDDGIVEAPPAELAEVASVEGATSPCGTADVVPQDYCHCCCRCVCVCLPPIVICPPVQTCPEPVVCDPCCKPIPEPCCEPCPKRCKKGGILKLILLRRAIRECKKTCIKKAILKRKLG